MLFNFSGNNDLYLDFFVEDRCFNFADDIQPVQVGVNVTDPGGGKRAKILLVSKQLINVCSLQLQLLIQVDADNGACGVNGVGIGRQ